MESKNNRTIYSARTQAFQQAFQEPGIISSKGIASLYDCELRIAVLPNTNHLSRAQQALVSVFNDSQYDDLSFECLSLSCNNKQRQQTATNIFREWDQKKRGQEIRIYLDLSQRTPRQWKEFMLRCWKALLDHNVEIGYVAELQGDISVASVPGLAVPFTYYQQDKTENSDAITSIVMTQSDLAKHGIDLIDSKLMLQKRINYFKNDIQVRQKNMHDANRVFVQKEQKLLDDDEIRFGKARTLLYKPKHIHYLNLFNEVTETSRYLFARTMRTGFMEKILDTLGVLGGEFLSNKEYRRHVGLFDYLTLFIKEIFNWVIINKNKNRLVKFFYWPSEMCRFVMDIGRLLFAVLGTLLASPIVALVHSLSKIKANQLKSEIAHMTIQQGYEKHTVGDYLKKGKINLNDLKVNYIGTYQKFTLYFSNRKSRDRHASCVDCADFSVEMDLSRPEHAKQLNALLKLNVGGLTRKLEKRLVPNSFFKSVASGTVPSQQKITINTHLHAPKSIRAS